MAHKYNQAEMDWYCNKIRPFVPGLRQKPLLIGDGVKQSKEALKMPCVKKLAQESGNSAKPQYIHGHMFGAIGLLLGTPRK